ncbi:MULTISPECIES: alkaline phosphatase family protein [unclassified Pseudoclavibacter]|uniref:alkaline phosphatase family protein n=1 Tax=unclassified Pseudoclavibacter TaxID=2615177 RepID=UPI001300CB3C|nr:MULTISPECIES: alkaline phosphatase family protein [unclassified Pseudoclavibacter]KAB1644604.1 DUF756 domain-containing protein [Pseudoclavibacter sp. CFCC 14310]KAB1663883.1 DUF756 domain-containing protein [Pseudoclavibacter sp. CFCC 13611]
MSSTPVPFEPEPFDRPELVPENLLKRGFSRRQVLQTLGLMGGAAVMGRLGGVGSPLAQAAEGYQLPTGFAGDMSDLKHVVILMQENRSFDHYYGSLPGVRGHDDKQALRFQNGTDVFSQPKGTSFVRPTHVTTVAGMETGLDHSYAGGTKAWNEGRYNGWIAAKGDSTMNYLTGDEMPWQYSLASAYTICDMNHCSVAGPTTPNRLYLWSGMSNGGTGNGGESNGDKAWETYPEQLQKAGVSWRIYVDNSGNGSSWVGDYTDNPIRGFANFTTNGSSAKDLANRADAEKNKPGEGIIWRAGGEPYKASGAPNNDSDENLNGVLKKFIDACKPDAEFPLPEVSWVVAPYKWCEHPSANPEHGAHFTNKVIQTLQSNPELWKSTLFILTFDENDGYFDHVLPPRPEPGTKGEFSDTTPIGYGARVPMILVSPWTRGGWVCSEVFDHTSVIRFLEQWTASRGKPAKSSNITDWRRTISGDLTSAIDFAHPIVDTPSLPDTSALIYIADNDPKATFTEQVPEEHKWSAVAELQHRPLAFQAHGTFSEDRAHGTVQANLSFAGGARGKGVSLQAFPDKYAEFSNTPYTVTADQPRTHKVDVSKSDGRYAFSVYGPDGFVRSHAGTVIPAGQNTGGVPRADVELVSGAKAGVRITLHNDGRRPVKFTLTANDYDGRTQSVRVAHDQSQTITWPTKNGYYDVVITADSGTGWKHRYAGRVAEISA